jgi:hypothetical protein
MYDQDDYHLHRFKHMTIIQGYVNRYVKVKRLSLIIQRRKTLSGNES